MKINCSYCHTESVLYFQSKDYNHHITEESFNHYRCPQCELIFIAPIPNNLSDYYSESYHFVPDSASYLEEGAEHERYKIGIVKRFSSGGRLLEIGPSYGSFTYLAKQAGFEVEAIEMNARCCRFLNEVIGVRAINSDVPVDAIRLQQPYDVVALWHVIEHLPDPWSMLDAICANLNPGGIVVLAAPNPDAFQFHVMGRYWPHVDAPRHVTLIPMKLLVKKLESLGMRAELITTTDRGSIGWNTFGWEFFFANLTSQSFIKKILRRVGRLVGFILGGFENKEGKGCAYTVVFRKGILK